MHFNLLIFVASTSALTDCEILKTAMPAVGASNCCNTTGITCNSNSRITSIIIPPAARDKSLPVAIGNLSELKEIALEGFGITGGIPESVCNLTNLVNLQMSYNKLGGSIPACIGQMTSLESFGCFECELNGSIPPSLWTMTSLRGLYLGFNELTGTLPPDIGNLAANITEIHVNNNQLSGPLPSEIGTLLNLQILHLDSNQFTGLLPDMSRLTKLTGYNFYNLPNVCKPLLLQMPSASQGNEEINDCTDCDILSNWLPTVNYPWNERLGCCKASGIRCNRFNRVSEIRLFNRNLTGPIIPELEKLTSLRILDLSRNNLTGEIPVGVNQLNKLIRIDLSKNRLTGPVPSLSNLTELVSLSLSKNAFTGSVVTSMALPSNSKIRFLFLDNNKFSGNISLLGNLPHLMEVSLYANAFSYTATGRWRRNGGWGLRVID